MDLIEETGNSNGPKRKNAKKIMQNCRTSPFQTRCAPGAGLAPDLGRTCHGPATDLNQTWIPLLVRRQTCHRLATDLPRTCA